MTKALDFCSTEWTLQMLCLWTFRTTSKDVINAYTLQQLSLAALFEATKLRGRRPQVNWGHEALSTICPKTLLKRFFNHHDALTSHFQIWVCLRSQLNLVLQSVSAEVEFLPSRDTQKRALLSICLFDQPKGFGHVASLDKLWRTRPLKKKAGWTNK